MNIGYWRSFSVTFFLVLLLSGCAGPGEVRDAPEYGYTLSSAEQGDVEAQYNLGVMYAKGRGVPQDYTEAARWFRKAAEQGVARAQHSLGAMYAEGLGVSPDYIEAYKWLSLAAESGSDIAASAREMLNSLTSFMRPAQIAKAEKLVREWRPKKTK